MPAGVPHTKTVCVDLSVTVVGIEPNYETDTQLAHDYRIANVYPHIASQGFLITTLSGSLAAKSYVISEGKKAEVEYITGVGHGTDDIYTGYYGTWVLRVGSYDLGVAKGKIFHFLSCNNARDLGPDLVVNGALAFFGYDSKFSYSTAIGDRDLFFECDSEIDKAFADGLTAEKVYLRVKALFEQRIKDFWIAGKVRESETLQFDLDHLQCPTKDPRWGNLNAKLT